MMQLSPFFFFSVLTNVCYLVKNESPAWSCLQFHIPFICWIMQVLLQTLKSPKALLKKVNNIINYKRSEKLQYTGVLKWNQNYLSWGFIFCNQTCLYKCINDSINICLYMMTGEGIGLITSMNLISKSSGINSDHKRSVMSHEGRSPKVFWWGLKC